MLFSAELHKSAIYIQIEYTHLHTQSSIHTRVYMLSLLNLPPTTPPAPSTPLSHHRALGWLLVIQQLPTPSHLFYTWKNSKSY